MLIERQSDEVLDESIEGLVGQLQQSAQGLTEWRELNPELLGSFQSVVGGWKELQYLIFCFSGGAPPEIVVFPWQFTWIEADRELSASRALAAVGFYKDAFKCLRSFFELTLFGLWIFQRNDHTYFDQWFRGCNPIPPITGESGVIRQLLRNDLLAAVDKTIMWADDATERFRLLSNFIHGRGKAYSNVWLWQRAHPNFNQEAWNQWLDATMHALQVVLVAAISHFPYALTPVSYFEKFGFDGPAGLFLDDEQVQVIRNAITEARTLGAMEDVILKDEAVQATMESVALLPDLTTDQIVETLVRFKNSLQDPEMRKRLQEIENDPTFKDAPTVQWSIMMNVQRKALRDASLGLIARKLALVRNQDDV